MEDKGILVSQEGFEKLEKELDYLRTTKRAEIAEKIKVATGVQTIQLHTGGMCHLDAEMTKQGLDNLDMNQVDLVIVTSPYASLETAFTFFSFSNACFAEVSISLILLIWLTCDAPGSKSMAVMLASG